MRRTANHFGSFRHWLISILPNHKEEIGESADGAQFRKRNRKTPEAVDSDHFIEYGASLYRYFRIYPRRHYAMWKSMLASFFSNDMNSFPTEYPSTFLKKNTLYIKVRPFRLLAMSDHINRWLRGGWEVFPLYCPSIISVPLFKNLITMRNN